MMLQDSKKYTLLVEPRTCAVELRDFADIYGEFSAEVTTGVDFLDPFITMGFVKDISEGKVCYGLKGNASGDFIFYYMVEYVLRTTQYEKYTQTYEFEIIIRYEDLVAEGELQLAESLRNALVNVEPIPVTVWVLIVMILAFCFATKYLLAMGVLVLFIREMVTECSNNQDNA